MISVVCRTCTSGLHVTGDALEASSLVGPESDLWPDKFQCFRCGGPAEGTLASVDVPLLAVTAQEAFLAVQGFGVPEERECSLHALKAFLDGSSPVHVVGKDVAGASRPLVDYLERADGSRAYFGASNDGAVVYKLTKPFSYATQETQDD